MLNINDLEKRWRKYRIKSYIPHIVILISLSIIFIIISTIKNYETFDNKNIKKENIKIHTDKDKELTIQEQNNKTKISTEQNITEVKSNIVDKITHEIVLKNKELFLSPSLNFMSNIKHSFISRYENDEVNSKEIYNKPEKKHVPKQKVLIQKPIEVIKIEVEKEIEKKTIQIDRQNTQEDISHVIKRFKKNNNPALSLFVAKKYYELGDYNNSYNYALITNEINDNIDASWIIFAKSLVKLNQIDQAVKTLQQYIEYSHSSQAKILIDEIKSGKFK